MPLPSDTDYAAAVQNPANCFADKDLRSGTVEVMGPALPIPKARSGNFATVYKLSCNSASWAVRCFTRPVHQDQRLRYDEISRALTSARIPHFVGFCYLEQGIRVGGAWHPIVKMDWVQGEPLDVYITRNLHDQRALLALCKAWVEMSALLAHHGIAHGDLQHGNVLVVQGAIKLVDYDGMFVPALAGRQSHESGHRNYQHPKRTDTTFGQTLDHFSEWVIFVSLLALASSPRLWAIYKGGDDCLLFRRADFDDPERSAVLTELCAIGDSKARAAAELFRALVQLPPDQVPPLNVSLVAASTSAQGPPAGALPDWIASHQQPPMRPREPATGVPLGAASWIIDHLESAVPPAKWQRPVTRERALLAVTIISLALAWIAAPSTAHLLLASLSVAAAFANVSIWYLLYRKTDAFQSLADAKSALARAEVDAKRSKRAMKEASNKRAALSKRHATEAQSLAKSRSNIEASRQAALAPLQLQLRKTIETVEARRKSIDQREAADRHAVTIRYSSSISVAQNNIAHIRQQEGLAISAEIKRLQRECVERALRLESILRVSVNRTGPLYLLRSAGIVTLFEADPGRVLRVRGVGKKTNDAIQQRRSQVATQAMNSAPTALDPAQHARTTAPFVPRRVNADEELSRLVTARDGELQRISTNCGSTRAEVASMLSQGQRDFSTAEQPIKAAFDKGVEDWSMRADRAETSRVKAESVAERVLADATKAHFSSELMRQRMLRDVDRLKCLRFKAYVFRILGAA